MRIFLSVYSVRIHLEHHDALVGFLTVSELNGTVFVTLTATILDEILQLSDGLVVKAIANQVDVHSFLTNVCLRPN